MDKAFKHPQIFADLLSFCQVYYPLHNNLPKPFRYTVGERILDETATCLKAIVLANTADKKTTAGCAEGASHVRTARASIEVIRGFLLLAWKLGFLSHAGLTELSTRLEGISKQAARWERWFVES
jgi:hypothetical protein